MDELLQKFKQREPDNSQLTTHNSQLTTHNSQLTLKFRRKFPKIKRQTLSILLIISLLVSQLTSLLVPSVYAASSPWSQTNWNGGGGQSSWSDTTKYSSGFNVATSTANQVTLAQTSSWYNSSWAYRRKITFDNSAQAENLTNFPVLIKLSSSNINYSNTQDSGQDIRFTDSNGITALSYEIEKWDESGSSYVWVKVPQIDASSNTDYIYMYYGDSSATDGQAATSVWDSNYKLVQHLKETSGTTTSDSTSNSNNGTKVSATEPNPTTTGQINGAQTFDGSNDYINVSDSDSLDFGTGAFTISAWIKRSVTGIRHDIFSNKDTSNSNNDVTLNIGSNDKLRLYTRETSGGTAIVADSSGSVSTSWTHVVGIRDASGNLKVYVNGSQNGSASGAAQNTTNGSAKRIGGNLSNTLWFNGSIDEVRISNTARSAAYIAAQYKSESDTFNTFASEEQQYPSSGTLTSSIFDTEFTGGAAWGTLTFAATTPPSTTATVKVRTSNSSSMTGATAFGSCMAITSGSDISSNSCVTDGNRYVQYLITLSTSDQTVTPTFTSYSLTFAVYDADAPNISLTALSPDPNSDNTPTLSGTATDTLGTVSVVQFQMDSTSGSWTACSASDGSFNSASEAFICTASTLTDGSHTMYIRATDSNGNTTSSSYSSDTFTIDATNPGSIDLDSPRDNSYTNSDRPIFKWKTTTDATAGLSKYVLEIDNPSIGSSQPSGDFTIDNIPTSRTTDYETNKYIVKYENFSDSDSTNNYILVYTRSHSDWGSSENDGKLREGRVSWKVKAVDNAGNETSSSRTLFVDRTNPNVEFTQINSTPYSSNNFSTTDKTPTIFGKITDPLAGGDSSQTQSESGPKLASGPKEVNIKVEKKNGLTYSLVTLYKINMDNPYYTCEENKTIDNFKQKCDKYLPFEYTTKENLDLGQYKITLTGKDKADNNSSEIGLTLNITTISKITTTEEKKVIEQETKELPTEQKEQIKEGLEVTKPTEQVPTPAFEKVGNTITKTGENIIKGTGNLITTIVTGIGNGVKTVFNGIGTGIAFVFDKTGQGLAFARYNIATAYNNTTQAIGQGYNNIAQNAPGFTKNVMLAVGDSFSAVGTTIGSGFSAVGTTANNAYIGTRESIANIAFGIAEKTQDVSDTVGFAFVKFGYLFVNEPTRIYDVKVLVLSPTSVKVSWLTNHPANGKINYGLDRTYPFEQQTDKRTTQHEFTLTNLQPDTTYLFEVMSQNKNYVYDANREFKTPPLENK